MGWSGGTFTRTNGTYSGANVWANDKAANVKIVASRHDTHDEDLADGINNCLTKDGQNSPTANISWGTFKITNLGNGSAAQDAATYAQTITGLSWTGSTGTLTATRSAGNLTVVITPWLSGPDKILGRVTSGAGAVEEIDCTAAGRALLDDADAAAQRTTLGLGTMATQAASAVAITGGSVGTTRVSELTQTIAHSVSGALAIDLDLGHYVVLNQSANITDVTFSNVPASQAVTVSIERVKDNSGTARTITWPAAVLFPGGTDPTLTQTANGRDLITLITRDGGTSFVGTGAAGFA